MAKMSKMPTDVNQRAKAIVDFATGTEDVPQDTTDSSRAAGGRRGGNRLMGSNRHGSQRQWCGAPYEN